MPGQQVYQTKKLATNDDRKMGVSQADLYEMYTYAGSYDVDNGVLIYPKQPDLDHIESTWTYADRDKNITIIQIDLDLVLNGRKYFRKCLLEKFSSFFCRLFKLEIIPLSTL